MLPSRPPLCNDCRKAETSGGTSRLILGMDGPLPSPGGASQASPGRCPGKRRAKIPSPERAGQSGGSYQGVVSPFQGSGKFVFISPGRCPGLACDAPLGLLWLKPRWEKDATEGCKVAALISRLMAYCDGKLLGELLKWNVGVDPNPP